MTDKQIALAIAYGSEYKNVEQFARDGLNTNKVQLASAMAVDGISKYVVLYTDTDVVSAAAAAANAQLRTLSLEEARSIPNTGLVFANVQLQAYGDIPIWKLNRRYPEGKGHLVLRIGGTVIQPVKKEIIPATNSQTVADGAIYMWGQIGKVGYAAAIPLLSQTGPDRLVFEEAFQLTPQQMNEKAEVILIDGAGHQHKRRVDLSSILGQAKLVR